MVFVRIPGVTMPRNVWELQGNYAHVSEGVPTQTEVHKRNREGPNPVSMKW
jgi:hypothetical protein